MRPRATNQQRCARVLPTPILSSSTNHHFNNNNNNNNKQSINAKKKCTSSRCRSSPSSSIFQRHYPVGVDESNVNVDVDVNVDTSSGTDDTDTPTTKLTKMHLPLHLSVQPIQPVQPVQPVQPSSNRLFVPIPTKIQNRNQTFETNQNKYHHHHDIHRVALVRSNQNLHLDDSNKENETTNIYPYPVQVQQQQQQQQQKEVSRLSKKVNFNSKELNQKISNSNSKEEKKFRFHISTNSMFKVISYNVKDSTEGEVTMSSRSQMNECMDVDNVEDQELVETNYNRSRYFIPREVEQRTVSRSRSALSTTTANGRSNGRSNRSGRSNPAIPTYDILNYPPDFDIFSNPKAVMKPIVEN